MEPQAAIAAAMSEVRASLELAREDARPVAPDPSLGRLTRLDAMQQQQMGLARIRRLDRRMQLLEAARLRVDQGTYGECVNCGEDVAAERLAARPEAALCLACERGTG